MARTLSGKTTTRPESKGAKPAPKQKRNRLPKRQNEVTALLRSRIIDGTYAPKQRLPIQVDLLKELEVSNVTLQRAIDTLCEEGFIEARRRTGTFVVDHPPHLAHYALVIPRLQNEPIWSHFYRSIVAEAEQRNRTFPGHLEIFYVTEEYFNSAEFKRLCQMITRHQFAGVIFGSSPHKFENTPVLTEEGVPRVAVMSQPKHGVPAIHTNPKLVEMGLTALAAKGAQRVATIVYSEGHTPRQKIFKQLSKYGIHSKPAWYGSFSHLHQEGLRSYVHLLMQAPEKERVDGFLILDDHLSAPVMEALLAHSPAAAKKIKIVAACNFPLYQEPLLPATLIGSHARDILNEAISLIDAQRRGREVALDVDLPLHVMHMEGAK